MHQKVGFHEFEGFVLGERRPSSVGLNRKTPAAVERWTSAAAEGGRLQREVRHHLLYGAGKRYVNS